jgi:cysteine sulfinate desulfinase/cysteine desulfurase-like protein
VALEDACANLDTNNAKVTALREKLINGLSQIPHCALNGDRENRLPGNVSFCFEGIEGESLLLYLDAMGICASSGSACTSGSLDPSHVLLAIGRVHDVAHGSLRLSVCHENTEEEIAIQKKEKARLEEEEERLLQEQYAREDKLLRLEEDRKKLLEEIKHGDKKLDRFSKVTQKAIIKALGL